MNEDHSCHYYQQGIRLQACGLFSGGAEKERAIREHLEHCENCLDYADDLRQMTHSMREWQTASEEIPVPSGSPSKWERAILDAAKPVPTSQRGNPRVGERLRAFWGETPPFTRAAVGFAWCFILLTHLATPRISTPTRSLSEFSRTADTWRLVWNELRTPPRLGAARPDLHQLPVTPGPSPVESPRGALAKTTSPV